jgi:aryl-alcohol dehydrogenase-like predicted oxidoreductase
MRYKRIADADVSAIAVGTWAIGANNWGDVDRDESIRAIHAMIDHGVNLIDTAPVYGFGHSEEVVGEAIRGKRDKVLLATKFGATWPNGPDAPRVRDNSRENCLREVELSLKRLGTDVIDIYIVHWPDFERGDEQFAESMGVLNELKQQGKIRYIGVSNHNQHMIEECSRYATVDVIQPPYSMVDRREEELMTWAAGRGIATMSYGSLGAGILTGAIRTLPTFDPKDTRYTFYDFYKEPKFSKVMALLETLDTIAASRGVPVAQVAINWSTQKPFVTTALLGVRNAREAAENCAALNWSLTDDEMAMIDRAIENTIGR